MKQINGKKPNTSTQLQINSKKEAAEFIPHFVPLPVVTVPLRPHDLTRRGVFPALHQQVPCSSSSSGIEGLIVNGKEQDQDQAARNVLMLAHLTKQTKLRVRVMSFFERDRVEQLLSVVALWNTGSGHLFATSTQMLYTTQARRDLPPPAAAAAEYQVTSDETTKFQAESASEHFDHHAERSANPNPLLPPFWNCVAEEFHAEEEEDVWKELNAASPSVLRHQWLWAYFNLPALRLSDHIVGAATLVAHTDGCRTHLHVICSFLQDPHVANIKDVYFGKEQAALFFREIEYALMNIPTCQLAAIKSFRVALDLRGACEAFEKAERLRDEQKLPSLIIVKNVPTLLTDRDGTLTPFGLVTIRKHKTFRGIVSLAPPNARSYNVYDMIDALELGDNSGVFAIGKWILDLRNFSGLRMLFRSELRSTRNEPTEFLLMDALYAFGGMAGRMEGAYDNQDEFQLVEGEYDLSTGSTLLPGTPEGTHDRGTPNSATDGDQLDEHDGTKSSEARSEAIHRTSSSVQSESCHGSERRPASEAVFSESAGNEFTPSKTLAEDGLFRGPFLSQARQLSADESRRPVGNNSDGTAVEGGENTEELSVQDDQPVADPHRSDCSNHLSTIVAQHPSARVTRSAEKLTEPGTTAASSEKDEGSDIAPCFSPDAEKGSKPLQSQAPGSCLSEAGMSAKEHDITTTGLQLSKENGNKEDQQSRCVENNEGCVEHEKSALDEQPKKPTLLSDDVLEKELHRWMVGGEYDGDIPCGGYFISTEENWCPSHEFEYWAIEDVVVTAEQNYDSEEPGTLSLRWGEEVSLLSVTNRAWAFCRTAEGTMGYVPTVAIPSALRNMADNTRMYARRTAYVDRFCKWKQTVLYPGDAVVILADRGKWILVRDYFRPFRQAYIPRFRARWMHSSRTSNPDFSMRFPPLR
ncbi:hypothetical protein Esti_005087 [Eimeria stiedai]